MQIIEWAKEHPAPAIIGGLVIVWGLSRVLTGSSGSNAGNANSAAAFYAAEAAQAQAGDAVQIAQIQAQSQTAQTLIAGATSVTNNTIWAQTDLATTQSNNAAAEVIAPIQAQASVNNNLINTLGTVAQLPGQTITSTSHSSGLFGLFGGDSTSTQYVPNPAAVSAANDLQSLLGSGLYAAH